MRTIGLAVSPSSLRRCSEPTPRGPGWEKRPACNTLTVATRPKQRNLGRLSEIAQVAVRHGFGYALDGREAACCGVDRAGASRDTAERTARRREGAAPERAAADRGRPRADVPGGEAREGAHPRARLHRHERNRRRVLALDPARARLPSGG